jgi:hypothetical protein
LEEAQKIVGPKNIATFCKMLTKMTRNVEEKNVAAFLKKSRNIFK